MSTCGVDADRRQNVEVSNVPNIDESQFQTIDEVQNMIRQLRLVELGMKKRRCNSPEEEAVQEREIGIVASDVIEDSARVFDQLSTIQFNSIAEMAEESWLMDSDSVISSSGEGEKMFDIQDDSYLDTGLRNVRYMLLNSVKAAINDERTAENNSAAAANISAVSANTSAASASATRLKRNASYVIRRDSELSSSPAILNYPSPNLMTFSTNTTIANEFSPSRLSFSSTQIYSSGTPCLVTDINTTPLANSNLYSADQNRRSRTRTIHSYATITKDFSPKPAGYSLSSNCNISGPNSPELNTTFTQGATNMEDMLSTSSNSNSSVYNVSMEEIHTMARIQEQSLAMTMTSTPRPLSRKETHAVDYIVNEDELPSPSRTWSTDTYCLDQSNPPSDQSSGVSSPRDSQSYENVQIAGDSVRRSMPNLALVKELNSNGKMSVLQVAPPMSQLKRQPHHISDTRLARPLTRIFSRPVSSQQINSTTAQRPHLYLNNTPERPYTAQYPPSLTRGQTFQKGSPVQETRPHTSAGKPQMQVVNTGRGFYQGQATQSRDGSGMGMPPPRYSTNFTPQKTSQLQAFNMGSNTTLTLHSEPKGTPAKSFASHSAGGGQICGNGSGRPSQLPSRLGSRIPAPGLNRTFVAQPSRSYRE